METQERRHSSCWSRHPRSIATRFAAALLTLFAVVPFGLSGYFYGPALPEADATSLSDAPAQTQIRASYGLDAADEHNPAPPPAPRALRLSRSEPMRIEIPAIGVDSTLMDLGLKGDGSLETPPEGFPAGWFTGAPTPGELGPAIIAGHVDWGGEAGVFYRLRDVQPGNEITVVRSDGGTAVFRVARVEAFAKDAFPTELVYGDIPYAGLRVITCGGAFDAQARSYVDNIVVFAELVRFNAG